MRALAFHRDDALVRAYLADRDAACPNCQYNLRGLAEARCPECGLGVSLVVAPASGTIEARWPAWFRRASSPVALLGTLTLGLGLAQGSRAAALPLCVWTIALAVPRFAEWLRGYAGNPLLPGSVRRRRRWEAAGLIAVFVLLAAGLLATPFLGRGAP